MAITVTMDTMGTTAAIIVMDIIITTATAKAMVTVTVTAGNRFGPVQV
jgi:hypothetical protein